MAAPFDHIANSSSAKAHGVFGVIQRKTVWNYMNRIIPQLKGFDMLELNCNYGEDLDLFGERGFNLVATDIGAEMAKITEKRTAQVSMPHGISSHYVDLDSLNENLFDKRFDLVFSNFGGLNGVNPESLKKMFQTLPEILKPGGRFVGIVMPKFCAWETIFFTMRFQFRRAFRRLTSQQRITNQNGTDIHTWYYNPSQLTKWSRENFRLVSLKPVGVAIPPAQLERFVSFGKSWSQRLNNIEKRISQNSIFSGMSDNYILDLELR